jgi:hypothetical protein
MSDALRMRSERPLLGRGFFAAEAFHPGETICVKGGHIFTDATLDKLAPILGPAEIQIAHDLFIPTPRRGTVFCPQRSPTRGQKDVSRPYVRFGFGNLAPSQPSGYLAIMRHNA